MQVDNRFNYALGERISIRGFGARAQFGVRGVKVLVDGIPATFPDGQTALNHVDLSLLSRAEVIRGPASAIYGNTAGGVIQLETEEPPAGAARARRWGSWRGATGSSASTAPPAGGADRRRTSSTPRAWTTAATGTSAPPRTCGSTGVSGWRGGTTTCGSSSTWSTTTPTTRARSPGRCWTPTARRPSRGTWPQSTGEEGRQGQIGATWRRQTAAGGLELTGYALARSIENPIPTTIIDLDRTAAGLRGLFRSRSPPAASTLQWTARRGSRPPAGRPAELREPGGGSGARGSSTRRRAWTTSGSSRSSPRPPPPASPLLGGLRYDRFRFEADDRLVTAANPDDSGSRTMDAVSPSLGASFAVAEALNLYGNVATSFETPTTTELANRPSGAGGLQPRAGAAARRLLEAGAKGRLGTWLAYQLAVYRAESRRR